MFELIVLFTSIIFILFAVGNLPYWLRWQSDKHGTARLLKRNKLISRRHKGITVDGRNSLKIKDSYQHFICACASGGGKSTVNIIPTLINWPQSIVCSDVKGDLAPLLMPFYRKKNYKTINLNLDNIYQSVRFNPLAHLSNQVEIRNFCKMIMDMNSNGKEDKFWSSGSTLLLEIVVRCLVNTQDERYMNMANLIHVMNHARANNQLEDLKYLVAFFGRNKRTKNNDTFDMYERFRHNEPKTLAGFIAGAINALSHFDNEELKILTAKNEIDFSDLRKQKTALFIITSVGKSLQYKAFLSLFYYQFLTYLRDAPVEENDQGIACCLDEFGNLSRLEGFAAITSLVRSKRVSLNIILQDLKQLDAVYSPDEASVILSNMSTHLILPGIMSLRTLEFYASLIGLETKEEFNIETGETNYTRRNLYNQDEIRRLSKEKNEALLLHSHLNPIKLSTKPIYKNKSLMYKAGIRSENGKLESTIPMPSPENRTFEPILYLDFKFLKKYVQKKMNPLKKEENGEQIVSEAA